MVRGGIWGWAVYYVVIFVLLASTNLRQFGLAVHVNGPANTSRRKPAVDVTPWRTWNIQNVVKYKFRDGNRRESPQDRPVERMAGTDGGVTKHVPQNSKALRQIGIWNLKKKAKPKKATIFDDTDNTYQSELRPVPSKFILVLKLDADLRSVTTAQLVSLKDTMAILLDIPPTNVIVLRPKPNSRTLEMYFVRPGSDPVVPPGVADLLPAKDVEAALASHSVMETVPDLIVHSVHSLGTHRYNPKPEVLISSYRIPVYMPDYFTYACGIITVLIAGLLIGLFWWILRRYKTGDMKNRGKLSPLFTPPPDVSQQICMYPCAKPGVNAVTAIQPDLVTSAGTKSTCVSCGTPMHCGSTSQGSSSANESSTPSYSSGSSAGTPVIGTPIRGCGTPIHTPLHTPPMKIKARGLLERRGSNASLTIDLGHSIHERMVGSPPKESSAEEYLLSAGNRMSRKQLRSCLKNPTALYEEFWEIPMNHPDRIAVAGSGLKNRYRSIIPNENTRVKLPVDGEDELCGYINANYIRGYASEDRAYIATQGPMPNTIRDLWRMAWLEKSPVIVMITKLKEKNKTKCEAYVPEQCGIYGDVTVYVRSVSEQDGYILRQLTIKYRNKEHSLLHAWYMAWPDHKAPDTARQLLTLVKEVDRHRYDPETGRPKGPVIVHCSAGIGRSGCFIATSIGMQQLREEHMVDVLGVVCAMRMDRGGMVQTNEQYRFVHQALCLYERELPDCPPGGE
ncbi:Receptor-type tyrosine-protein phosphatase R [Lamellibrachia satsuma]|nr:Receptor-type tyrosine-protein phosphatase R [Lamellibrachia satsuma]